MASLFHIFSEEFAQHLHKLCDKPSLESTYNQRVLSEVTTLAGADDGATDEDMAQLMVGLLQTRSDELKQAVQLVCLHRIACALERIADSKSRNDERS